MEILLAVLIGVVIGSTIVYLLMGRRLTALRLQVESSSTLLGVKTIDLNAKSEQLAQLQAENRHLNATCVTQENELRLLKEQVASEVLERREHTEAEARERNEKS